MERYLDTSLDFITRAEDLVSRMTLEEKIHQTVHTAAAIRRLGIPAYNWWNEGLHGVARAGVATVFPQAIGLAATFDDETLRIVGDITGTEARAKYNANSAHGDRDIYKGLTFWSPNVNIFRDPRWGRGHETYGEDPYLTSRLGVAFIKGIQGNHPKYLKAAACAKHFAVHSGPESLRHEFDALVSPKELRETYLPAFKSCVEEGRVEAVMGAYNRVNGQPCCGSEELLVKILRREWRFDGHVVSDCWAIKDFHEGHRVTVTVPESVALAINSECDLNCGNLYLHLMIACQEGLVTEGTITRAVVRLMTTRMRLGLFDPPEDVPFSAIGYLENDAPAHSAFSEEAARRGLVLLKNDGLLPLKRESLRTIAVIGPNADSRAALQGNYYGTASQYITVLDGIRGAMPEGSRLLYAQGCHLYMDRDSELSQYAGDRLAEAAEAASLADIAVVCVGLDADLEGEEGDTSNAYSSGDKPDLRLPGLQEELLKRALDTGTPVIVVNLSGSAMDLRLADQRAAAVVQAFYPGARGGKAVAGLLFGAYSPCGRLPVTFYQTGEELPDMCDYSMYAGGGRTYRFMSNEPLYPFGYGLSYTAFAYENVTACRAGDEIKVGAQVRNTGARAGREIVQLYIRHADRRWDVPNHALKGVRAVDLRPGEAKCLSFTLDRDALSVFDGNGNAVYDAGAIEIFVGGGQPDARTAVLTGKTAVRVIVE